MNPPSDDEPFSQIERCLLEQKGYRQDELDAIERRIRGIWAPRDHEIIGHTFRLTPATDHEYQYSPKYQYELSEVGEEDFLEIPGVGGKALVDEEAGTVPRSEADDEFPGLDATWKALGVRGVITRCTYVFVVVRETFYTFLNWREIRDGFEELELTPLPSKADIEDACGSAGLNLPSVSLDDLRYFDFEFVVKSQEARIQRQQELAQAREEVLRYLVGNVRRQL